MHQNNLRRRKTAFRQFESLEPRTLLAADPVISEFQAINRTTILDEDGDASDWIEVRNAGDESANLEGWYLTDDSGNLEKWRIPSLQLDPGSEALVFASGKDRRGPGELHANFRLDGDGEFLALVQPDGTTIAQDFGLTFPAQREDQSYGLAQAVTSITLAGESSSARAFVPADDSLGDTWRNVDFDDSIWDVGTGAVGFERLRPETTVQADFASELETKWTVDLPAGSLGTVELADGGLKFSVPEDQDTTPFARGLAPIVYRDLPIENAAEWEMVAQIEKETPGDRGSVGIMIYDAASGKPALQLEQSVNRSFTFLSGGQEVGISARQTGTFFLRLQRDELGGTWTASIKVDEADEWTTIATVTDGTFAGPIVGDPKVAVFARTPQGTIDAEIRSLAFTAAPQQPVYADLIGVDVEQSLWGKNSSAYIRYPFNIDGDINRFDRLRLGVRFDDGFEAYLNGNRIVSSNAPIGAQWDSAATGVHGAQLQEIPLEVFDVPVDLLRAGDNVLAVHGMNVAETDLDFFFQGGLVGSELSDVEVRSFTSPTPGAPNLAPNAPQPNLVGQDGVFFGSALMELQLPADAPDHLEIRYTLDGSEPNANSTLYETPVPINTTSLLQARTFDTQLAPDFSPSDITSKTFIAVADELRTAYVEHANHGIRHPGSGDSGNKHERPSTNGCRVV